ncbi:adenylyltransferase/cytidyltransferase family protein [Lutibacter aestuarii]|uniref:Adenylyltransferase/cytidyltransferase family protein n=1 Tax=Lutibacter aestuarii TaxID=861111 RepID=A0ABW2Z6W7_9FLAO|nr:adenylyltransferase/cytidyltransferase family protein [uncultured Lutibacter sp.]
MIVEKLQNEFDDVWDIFTNEVEKSFTMVYKKNSFTKNLEPIGITIEKINEFLKETPNELKLITDPVIKIEVNLKGEFKKFNKMYTSGCFDIFHYGHLNILERTKKMCNYLVVGVSTDELILKEKGRLPVIPFNERIRIIEALSFVDQVIPQVDKNKQAIVDRHNIDAISVGEDWKGKFPKTTCHVEYLPYTYSVSSTILKDALKLIEK